MRESTRLRRENRLFRQQNEANRNRLLKFLYGEYKERRHPILLELVCSDWDEGEVREAASDLAGDDLLTKTTSSLILPWPAEYLELTRKGKEAAYQLETAGHFTVMDRWLRVEWGPFLRVAEIAFKMIPKILGVLHWLIR